MNKMHTFAQVVFVALGIYMIVLILPMFVSTMPIVFWSRFGWEGISISLVSLAVTLICIYYIYRLLICRREKLAEMVVGSEEPPGPEVQVEWIAVVLRLIVIIVGLILMVRFLRGLGGVLASLSADKVFNMPSSGRMTQYIIGWILNLPLAIYFICGAPHFVRWQVRKTLEFAGKGDEDIKD